MKHEHPGTERVYTVTLTHLWLFENEQFDVAIMLVLGLISPLDTLLFVKPLKNSTAISSSLLALLMSSTPSSVVILTIIHNNVWLIVTYRLGELWHMLDCLVRLQLSVGCCNPLH